MSFFGFDTSLPPRQKPSGVGGGGAISDPFDPTLDDGDDDAAFEEKLRGLRAAGQEDVEIYTWGGDGGEGTNDGLGDLLDETGDAFNDDTFGMGDADVGKEFDFSSRGGLGAQADSASLPSFFDPVNAKDTSAAGKISVRKNDAAFASTMDDFWRTPEPKQASAEPSAPTAQQQPGVSAAPLPVQSGGRPLTMEEVEAEMRARRAQAAPAAVPPTQPQQQVFNEAVPPPLGMADSAFPVLGSEPPRGVPAPPSVPTPAELPAPLSLPPLPHPNDPNAQAAIFARMRAMLETLPNPIQGRIMALPPYMHFGATESVVRDYPALTVAANREKLPQQIENPRLWPRIDGSAEEQNIIRFMVDTALAKIDEAHRLETKRQTRMAKIRAMSTRNNIMSRSDKDFITRIQVSQLITSDPYTDDFYAHIYFALHGNHNRVVTAPADDAGRPTAPAAPEEGQPGQRKTRQRKQQANRRDNAMVRMQQQVERIVTNRKERIDKAAGSAALEGALGRVSLGTTKAPRQMLQINQEGKTDSATASPTQASRKAAGGVDHAHSAAQEALQGASLAQASGGSQKRPALTRFEVLSILERLYDVVLSLEQSRRNAPADSSEANESPDATAWRAQRDGLVKELWTELRVLEPLEVSDPHPFVSLVSTTKGKKLLPRALRHLNEEQTLTALTMIVASFDGLDVVRDSALLDEDDSALPAGLLERRAEVKRQSDAFANTIVPTMLSLITTVPMRIVSGMLALFIERNETVRVAQSKPGIAFLTIFLSRAASLKQASGADGQAGSAPSQADLAQWTEIFNLLIQRLAQPPTLLTTLFPSTRARARLPFGVTSLEPSRKAYLEVEDREVWQFMAALAVSASMSQQQILVTGLREKILENVMEAKQWTQANPAAASAGGGDLRIRNVNLLLHALNLDAAQITV